MSTILNHLACPSCGHEHQFCELFGAIVPHEVYEYVCPVTGKWSAVTPVATGEAVRYPPQGVVQFAMKSPASGKMAA